MIMDHDFRISVKHHIEVQMTEVRLTMTVDEAATALGLCRNSAYAAAKDGTLPTIRIGKRLLVPRVAIERLLAGAHQPTPAAGAAP